MAIDQSGFYGHSTLEVSKKDSTKFAVLATPDDSPKYYYEPPPVPQTPSKKDRFTRWPFLVLYAVLIAIIAGVIGGLVGKTIEAKNATTQEGAGRSAEQEGSRTISAPSSCPTSIDNSPTNKKNETEEVAEAQQIKIPFVDCDKVDEQYLTSDLVNVGYRIFCDVDWDFGDNPEPDIVAILAPSASECIEACDSINIFNGTSAPCAGGIYVPEWFDGERAMRDNNNKPQNCFLKKKVARLPRRNTIHEIKQVLGLCLPSVCPAHKG